MVERSMIKRGTIFNTSIVLSALLLLGVERWRPEFWILVPLFVVPVMWWLIPWRHSGRIISYNGEGFIRVIMDSKPFKISESVYIYGYNEKAREVEAAKRIDDLIKARVVGRIADFEPRFFCWPRGLDMNTITARVSIEGEDIFNGL